MADMETLLDVSPLDEEASGGLLSAEAVSKGRRTNWLRWTAVCLCAALLGVGLYTAWPRQPRARASESVQDVEVKENLESFDDSDVDWPVLKKDIKREQYNPAACFARLSLATAWSASMGLKIRAAMQECNFRNYRDDPTPFRRLHEVHEVHRMPSLPQEASIHYPTPPWSQLGLNKKSPARKGLAQDLDGPAAEPAYNLTEGTLDSRTLFAFGQHWTVEGWHYMKEHHPGCVWDTRSDAASAGLRACFSGGVLALEVFADAQLIPVLADETVPLSTWVHLAVQRRGKHLEFFLNGSPAGNATVPGQLTDEMLPQSNIRLGGSVDDDPQRKYKGMVSNIRITTDSIYKSGHMEPDPNLDQLRKTRFLLKSHYADAVSGRQMKRSGNVTTKYDPDILMETWKAEGLIDDDVNFTPAVNESRLAVLRKLFPFEDEIYKTEFLGAFCARCVLQILKEITTIQDRLMTAVPLCDATATSPQCYKAVNYAFRQAVSMARYGAELQPRCLQTVNEDFRGDFRCSERLEGLSWALDGFNSQVAKTYRICHDNDLSSPLLDLGACVGESMSAAGYMFASALLLESALGFDCPNQNDDERPVTEAIQLTCARDSTAIFRTTFLAASKAARAAGHCGGTDTLCGRSALRSAAAISGIAETGVFLRVFCHGKTKCCQKNPDTEEIECKCSPKDLIELKRSDKSDRIQCARFSGSSVKLMGSAALAAGEAEGQCKFSKTAESSCQTMPGAVFAGLGFFIENAARVSRDCPPKPVSLSAEERRKDIILGPSDPTQFYQCGQNTKRLGVSMDVVARGIAGAVVNCPYGDLDRVTKPVKSARRFFTP